MSEAPNERRRFHRIATDKPVVLTVAGRRYHGTVLDISLRGLLFAHDDGAELPSPGAQARAEVQLDGGDCRIQLDGVVAHTAGDHLGLRSVRMDLDSAARLRRLVELNLADSTLLERDLEQLLTAEP